MIQRTLFEDILKNRTDGASALFARLSELASGQPPDVVVEGLRACRDTFPLMAVWTYALEHLSEGKATLDSLADEIDRMTRTTVDLAVAALKNVRRVATLSNSSLVRRAILAAGPDIQVLCARSEPGGEGHALATALQAAGWQANVVADRQLNTALDDVDAVLLGADQYDTAAFINKVGSRALAQRAGQLDRPVLVLAEKFKQVSRLPRLTPRLASLEIEDQGRRSLRIMFERVPWQPHIRLIAD